MCVRLPRALACCLACWLPLLVSARPITPLRKQSALKLLSRLAERISDGNQVSMDIGGTLAKVVVFVPESSPPPDGEIPRFEFGDSDEDTALWERGQRELSVYSPVLGGSLHFFVFETRHMNRVIEFLSRHWPRLDRQFVLRATGGGSYKHAAAFREIGWELDVGDELGCTIAGLNFLLHQGIRGELFSVAATEYSPLATPEACEAIARTYVPLEEPPEKYLYVSIGSGVSIMEVHRDPQVP